MAAEAGHRRDIGARSRVRFAEGCLQGRRDAGARGETEAAAVVVLAAVVAGTVAGGRGELARAVTAQPPPAVLAPPVVQGGEAETAGEAGGDSAAGGSSADAPTPASRLSAPTAVDPPMVQGRGGGGGQCGRRQQRSRRHFYRRPRPAPQPSSPAAADPPPDQGEELDGPARVAAADAKLDAVLAASGGARQAVAKDGACQFAAVAVQVSGWTAATLRKAAVDMLEQDDMLPGSSRRRVARSTSLGCGDLTGGATRCRWKRSAGPRACRSGSSRCRRRVCLGCSGWARRGGSWPS